VQESGVVLNAIANSDLGKGTPAVADPAKNFHEHPILTILRTHLVLEAMEAEGAFAGGLFGTQPVAIIATVERAETLQFGSKGIPDRCGLNQNSIEFPDNGEAMIPRKKYAHVI
jgi:hypothetical protein